MLDDYSSIFTGFLLGLVLIPVVASVSRNTLRNTAVKTAVVNGLVVVGLLTQYVHLVFVATYAPHHSSWENGDNYVRLDCYEGQKGGKLANDFRDCLMGQGSACTEAEPCTPCPAGGNASSTSTDFHRYITNYTQFLCRNCTDPYRAALECQFAVQHGPFCLVDDLGVQEPSRRQCPTADGVRELSPRTLVPQLPLFILEELGYVDEDGNVVVDSGSGGGGGGATTTATSITTTTTTTIARPNSNNTGNNTGGSSGGGSGGAGSSGSSSRSGSSSAVVVISAWEHGYRFPTPSGGRACERCCTRQWLEDDWIPADPVVEPPGGDFTKFVSIELAPGEGVGPAGV